ncbi:unnamed protein product [Peniophora sp. CBMAI 1063]|nr:unnamed protein product [Peniophora sp. CBMAI 1063]
MHALLRPSSAPPLISLGTPAHAHESNALPALFSQFITDSLAMDGTHPVPYRVGNDGGTIGSHNLINLHRAIFRIIGDWPAPVSFAFDTPLWKSIYNVEETLLSFPHIHQLRVRDPLHIEDVIGPSTLDDFSFPRTAFATPASRLDLLWVVQSISDWTFYKAAVYCFALAARVKQETSLAEEEGQTAIEQHKPIVRLRLDFVTVGTTVQQEDGRELLDVLGEIAEVVELRFLR